MQTSSLPRLLPPLHTEASKSLPKGFVKGPPEAGRKGARAPTPQPSGVLFPALGPCQWAGESSEPQLTPSLSGNRGVKDPPTLCLRLQGTSARGSEGPTRTNRMRGLLLPDAEGASAAGSQLRATPGGH